MSDAVTDLFAAIHANNVEGVRLLLQAEPGLLTSASPTGLSPVLFAAYYHRPDVLRALLDLDAPLNIFEAAAAGQVKKLRDALNADPTQVKALSPDGFTSLGLAALFGHQDVAAELISRGADVNAVSRNPMQVQPLHSAVAGNHTGLVGLLLDAGADVNATQPGGLTPLMSAAQNGNAELLELLLAHGADPAAHTEDGRTAYSLAEEEDHQGVLARLAQARAAAARQSQENGKAIAAYTRHTGGMNDKEVIGRTGAVTGVDTPDPKDSDPTTIYTTTPAEDRVGGAETDAAGAASGHQPVTVPDAKEVTGQFEHLATRDAGAMEHKPQAPEYAGAQSVAALGTSTAMLDAVVPGAGLGSDVSGVVAANDLRAAAADPNPGYTPPSKMTPPHQPEHSGPVAGSSDQPHTDPDTPSTDKPGGGRI